MKLIRLSVAACVLFSYFVMPIPVFCLDADPASPPQADIEEFLKKSEVLASYGTYRVSVLNNLIKISVYKQKKSNSDDCKIDAVLIGKDLMAKFPSISRLAMDFFPAPQSARYTEVSVSLPEIVAYGSGSVDHKTLLRSINMEERVDSQREAEIQGKLDKSTQIIKDAVAKGEHPEKEWVSYHAPSIAFDYPAAWKIRKEFDGELVAEFASPDVTTYKTARIELKVYRSADKVPVAVEARKHMMEHQGVRGSAVVKAPVILKFGRKNQLTGLQEEMSRRSWRGPGQPELTYQRYVYFGWPGFVYRLSVKASREDYQHVSLVFNHLLSTVRTERSNTPVTSEAK
jgi:hypothetical protein